MLEKMLANAPRNSRGRRLLTSDQKAVIVSEWEKSLRCVGQSSLIIGRTTRLGLIMLSKPSPPEGVARIDAFHEGLANKVRSEIFYH